MRKIKKLAALLVAISVFCTLFITQVEAASIKNIYVVTEIKISDDKISNAAGIITYDKNGFIKSTDITNGNCNNKESFSYDSKGQMKTYITNITYDNGSSMGATIKYTWKNGQVRKMTTEWTDNTKDVVKYTYKNNRVTSGSYNNGKLSWTFSYDKKGRLSSMGQYPGSMCVYTRSLKYDSLGNVTKMTEKSWGNTIWTEKHKLSYDSKNLVNKLTITNPYGESSISKRTFKFTYKKITVKKAYVKAVEEQQWKLVNNMGNGAVLNLFYK